MNSEAQVQSFVVFPYLKTKGRFDLGGLTFRPTSETSGLSEQDAAHISSIANMLYLQDNLRIKSATYAVAQRLDLGSPSTDLRNLRDIQAAVAFIYSSPRHEFGDTFLSTEHATMALFTPNRVTASLVQPSFHVDDMGPSVSREEDVRGTGEGYEGLLNFQHHFWVAAASRLYPPTPRMSLNMGQDFCSDMRSSGPTAQLLIRLLSLKVRGETESRMLTAIRWYSDANRASLDEDASAVSLAIAFEALLRLPSSDKTDRLVDAISMLLGRVPRVDVWARQFYDLRSRVAHEGRGGEVRFVATDDHRIQGEQRYQSLLSYGRLIFQLCFHVVATGAEIARRTDLGEKLITNQQRFQRVCASLSDTGESAAVSPLSRIEPLVHALEQYRYVPESGLEQKTILAAITRALEAHVLALMRAGSVDAATLLDGYAKKLKDKIEHVRLGALRELDELLTPGSGSAPTLDELLLRRLVNVGWGYLMRRYHWIHILDRDADAPA